MSEELTQFVKSQLELHRNILLIVKHYIDNIIKEVFNIDPADLREKDQATYYALILELTRSIFVNYSVEKRKKTINH